MDFTVAAPPAIELMEPHHRSFVLGYYHARDSLIESQRWPPLRYAGLASHFANGNALEWRNSYSWTNPGHPVWGPGQRELWGRKQVYGFMKPASEAAGLRCYVNPVSNTHNRFPLIDVLSVLANDYRATCGGCRER